MCGIMGGVSHQEVNSVLLEGLKRLEYRGYDSAGIAVINQKNKLKRLRVQGKVALLAEAVQKKPLEGQVGIAHTRWATHGKPCEQNAHPHISHDEIALVHNGIIENHQALRKRLEHLGYLFVSETDTEVAAHLVHYYFQLHHDLLLSVQKAATDMQGAFALGVIHTRQADRLVALRQGSPLVIGIGQNEHFIASDALALAFFCQKIVYLEEGDSACITAGKITIYNQQTETVKRPIQLLQDNQQMITKSGYRHFMLKEIYEQNQVIANTLTGRIENLEVLHKSFGNLVKVFPNVRQIHIIACGTSYHASLVARYWLEALTNLPTNIEIASEYRYREVVVSENTLFIAVSQSGETADTLAALTKAKSKNYLATLAICNMASSTLVRLADHTFLTQAGIEIGVASTKAFTTQLVAFLMLAAALCKDDRSQVVLQQLKELPQLCEQTLTMSKTIETLAELFINKKHALFLGRGVHYPVALEGALKLKEISYIHAEAYPAGELKHGPLALVDEEMPVIAIAPNDELLDKLKTNLHEVSARGGQLIVFVDDGHAWENNGAQLIKVPSCGNWISPIIYTIPLQLLAYYVAINKGTDVDQPRNLAKSVTVE